MAHKHEQAVIKSIAVMEGCIDALMVTLKHPELNTIRSRVVTGIRRSAASLQQLTGVTISNPGSGPVNDIIANLKPLTSIGGEPLERISPVGAEDLEVSPDEKQRFIQNRDALRARFLDMVFDDIFLFARQPQGEAMIRSIARLAGHPAFRSAELTEQFIEDVKERMRFTAQLEQTATTAADEGTAGLGLDDLDDDDEDLTGDNGGPNYGGLPNFQHTPPPPPPPPSLTIDEEKLRAQGLGQTTPAPAAAAAPAGGRKGGKAASNGG